MLGRPFKSAGGLRNSTCLVGLALLFALGTALMISRARTEEPAGPTPADEQLEIKAKVYASIDPEDEKGFQRMPKPKAGEWLYAFSERPQPFDTYRARARIRPSPQRRTLVLQPLGEFTDEQTRQMESLREYAEAFFQLPARIEKPIDLSAFATNPKLCRQLPLGHRHGGVDRQFNASGILTEILIQRLPEDAVVCLGITMEDLWEEDLNYVFGLGSLKKRVGVYSLCRYSPEFWGEVRKPGDEVLGLKRACKVLNHETGHLFGLSHCIFYCCSMNGSNSLTETDAAPIHFCPLCHRKLLWNIGFDPLKRFQALEAYYRKYQMKDEAEWMTGRIEHWKNLARQELNRKEIGDEEADSIGNISRKTKPAGVANP